MNTNSYESYPNIELQVYKVKELIRTISELKRVAKVKFEEAKLNKRYLSYEFDVDIFSQVWGSTCLGFDISEDGSPAIGGRALTKAYTTVIYERVTDRYYVFFGPDLCYVVSEANEAFLEDLKNHQLVSLSESFKKY